MTFQDALKRSFIAGFTGNTMPTSQMVITLVITFLMGVYIFFVYKQVNKSSLYDRSFHVSMAIISVVTAGIILAMQSSIVISLGMVGALSIVRFRTAVKDAMDLLFLFWSIGEGIICGAGLYEVAILVALVVTAGIFLLQYMPFAKAPYLLMVHGNSVACEDSVLETVKKHADSFQVKSRNLKKNGFDMILEVHTKEEKALMESLSALEDILQISLLTHEGEVRI